MINAIESYNINNRNNISISPKNTQTNSVRQTQNAVKSVTQLVYESLSMLTVASEKGLSKEGLTNFKQLLENENMTDKNAYKLVGTLLDRFNALSSDGDYITSSDLTTAVTYSVSQSLSNSNVMNSLIQDGKLKISSEIADLYGMETAKTIAIAQFLDSLSDETVSKLLEGMKNAQAKSSVKSDDYYGNRYTKDDYQTVNFKLKNNSVDIRV